jgi:hypothetical protein
VCASAPAHVPEEERVVISDSNDVVGLNMMIGQVADVAERSRNPLETIDNKLDPLTDHIPPSVTEWTPSTRPSAFDRYSYRLDCSAW